MIKPKKTKTGRWTAQVYLGTGENGRKIHPRVTADTKEECLLEIALLKARKEPKKSEMTVKEAVDKYVELCELLSPATVQGYKKINKYAFANLMRMKVSDLDSQKVQIEINKEAKRLGVQTKKPIAPKTVHNEWGLISAALRMICEKTFIVKLPTLQHENKTVPELDDILDATVGTIIELPMLLAGRQSLRMSELRGLKCSDLDGNILHVQRAMLEIDNGDFLRELNKTDASRRDIILYERIRKMIIDSEPYQEYLRTGEDRLLVPMTRHKIYYHFEKAVKAAGIKMSFHDLRHVFASIMLSDPDVSAPEKITQFDGGWKTDTVMKRRYSNNIESVRREVNEKMDDRFERKISQIRSQKDR